MAMGLSKSVLNFHRKGAKNTRELKSRNGRGSAQKTSTPCTPSQTTDKHGASPTPKQYPNLDAGNKNYIDGMPRVSSFA